SGIQSGTGTDRRLTSSRPAPEDSPGVHNGCGISVAARPSAASVASPRTASARPRTARPWPCCFCAPLTAPLLRVTASGYDAQNRLISVTDPRGATTTYALFYWRLTSPPRRLPRPPRPCQIDLTGRSDQQPRRGTKRPGPLLSSHAVDLER